ncbi:hypothetical protein FDC61_04590 [Clostridium botulinum]|nr:hypothetical protein [Clostridium botulinum]NFO73247.1 hypothetical protein [Clostridium botulinum]
MIKKLNVLLEKLNREAYDGQFYWENRDEIIPDIINFMEYDKEEDLEAIGCVTRLVRWEGVGEYVLSMQNEEIIKLEKALQNETYGTDLNEILNYCKELEREVLKFQNSQEEMIPVEEGDMPF